MTDTHKVGDTIKYQSKNHGELDMVVTGPKESGYYEVVSSHQTDNMEGPDFILHRLPSIKVEDLAAATEGEEIIENDLRNRKREQIEKIKEMARELNIKIGEKYDISKGGRRTRRRKSTKKKRKRRRTKKKRRMKKGGNKNEEIADGKFSVTSEDGKIASNKMNFATKKEYFSWLKERPGIWRTGFHLRFAFYNNKLLGGWEKEVDDGTIEWYYHLRNNMVQQHRIFLMKEAKGKENYNKMIPIIRYEEKNEDGTFDIFDFRMVPEYNMFNRCSGRFSGTIDAGKKQYISKTNKGKLYSGQPCKRKMVGSNCEQYYSCIGETCTRDKPKAAHSPFRMKTFNIVKDIERGRLPFTLKDYVGSNLPDNLRDTKNALSSATYDDNNYTPSIIASSSDFNKPNSGGKKKKRRRKSTKKKRKRRRTKKKRRRRR